MGEEKVQGQTQFPCEYQQPLQTLLELMSYHSLEAQWVSVDS